MSGFTMNKATPIPSELHFIWLGCTLPKNYLITLLNVLAIARRSGFKLNLWVDHPSNYYHSVNRFMPNLDLSIQNTFIQIKHLNELKLDMKSNKFFLKKNDRTKIKKDRKAGAFTRSSDRFSDFWECVDREMLGAKNLAAASDLLRYAILYLKGGYYFDTDTKFKFDKKNNHKFESEPLLLDFKTNIRCSYSVFKFNERQTISLNSINGGNDIIASLPKHSIMRAVIIKVINDYNLLDLRGIHKKTMMDKKRYRGKVNHPNGIRTDLTLALSGPGVLADAIQAVLKKKSLNPEQIDSICMRRSEFSQKTSLLNMSIDIGTTDMTWIKTDISEKPFDDSTLPNRWNFFLQSKTSSSALFANSLRCKV